MFDVGQHEVKLLSTALEVVGAPFGFDKPQECHESGGGGRVAPVRGLEP
jgi:hypothetical protein